MMTLGAGLLGASMVLATVGCRRNEPARTYAPVTDQYGRPIGAQPPPAPAVGQIPPPRVARSPLAPSCQADTPICGFFRCDVQAQKCAMPCSSSADCVVGAACLGAGGPTAICVPGLAQ